MGVGDFLKPKMVSALEFEPTPCQEKLFDALADFMTSNGDDTILVVNGFAGTGKTSAIAAFVRTIKEFKTNVVLLAPTGRAAKVLSTYSDSRAYTIHKHIYRQKSMKDGIGLFTLNMNLNKETVYIVDEASLISNNSYEQSAFGSGHLLDDLVDFVRSNYGNRLIIIGDSAQLPPVGMQLSEALDPLHLEKYGRLIYVKMTSVVRQAEASGILINATSVRNIIDSGKSERPSLFDHGFTDVKVIGGGEILEELNNCYEKYGMDNTLVLCRSNKRANRYNQGIRGKILYREEQINKGDKVMIVKNCYQFLDNVEETDFIANGDVAEILKIGKYETRYGLNYAEATLKFSDYNELEIKAKVVLDTLTSEGASLSSDDQRRLFAEIMEDYSHISQKRKRIIAVREDKYFNALQIKFSSAVTCHKSQGGQWKAIFIDNPFWREDFEMEDLKWLYTAITRATDIVYFVNFDKNLFK